MRNLDRFQRDIENLISLGDKLLISMQRSVNQVEIDRQIRAQLGENAEKYLANLPRFSSEYQIWYSEAISIVKQLMPDRLTDFRKYYERPVARKDLSVTNYTIEDFLHGVRASQYEKEIAGPKVAITLFEQQLNIVRALVRRLESSLFQIRQMVQADLFDSELEGAKSLLKHGYMRAAGAMAGVVLERHLLDVAKSHNITVKSKPSISDLNDKLKSADVYDVSQWRRIQYLGDIRNMCDHSSDNEPKRDQVSDLILGVDTCIKNIF